MALGGNGSYSLLLVCEYICPLDNCWCMVKLFLSLIVLLMSATVYSWWIHGIVSFCYSACFKNMIDILGNNWSMNPTSICLCSISWAGNTRGMLKTSTKQNWALGGVDEHIHALPLTALSCLVLSHVLWITLIFIWVCNCFFLHHFPVTLSYNSSSVHFQRQISGHFQGKLSYLCIS